MRGVVLSFLVLAGVAPFPLAGQSKPAAGKSQACSLLTREIITKHSVHDKQLLNVMLNTPQEEERLGPTGSACSYAGVTLQVDTFTPAALDKMRTKAWAPVSGVGDAAWVNENQGRWVELYARAGTHVIAIQLGIPQGRTAASVQPNLIALGKELLAQVK